MLCQDCPKKNTCTELCEKTEKYVNQDYKYLRELPCDENLIEYLNYVIDKNWPELVSYFTEELVNFPFLTPLQNKTLHLFYFQGLTYKQIARHLNGGRNPSTANRLSVNAVDYQLRKARKEILRFYSISEEE